MRDSTEDAKVGKENNAHPHTIKKFELVEGYVKSWIHKLMITPIARKLYSSIACVIVEFTKTMTASE